MSTGQRSHSPTLFFLFLFLLQAQLYEMLAVLRGHCDGRSPYDQLADEDLAAVEALTSRSKKRKRSKQKK